jgi:hypothetical protein
VTEYRVVVVAPTRHGWRNLHTFVWDDDTERWVVALGWLAQKTFIAAGDASRSADGQFDPERFKQLVDSPQFRADPRRRAQRINALTDPSSAFHLNTDAIVPMPILSLIFDVLRANERHRVNVDDIKIIESQHGSRIRGLNRLSDEDRRHAVTLLHDALLSIVLRSDCQ